MSEIVDKFTGADMRKGIVRFFYGQTMLIILIVMIIVMSIVSEDFLSTGNLFNIVRQFTVHGVMACGMTIVIIGKGVDLSAASILALCAVVNVMLQPYGYLIAIVVAMATGFLCGFVNGYLLDVLVPLAFYFLLCPQGELDATI